MEKKEAGERLDALVAELNAWQDEQGLAHESADDQIRDENISDEQHEWLDAFILEWEEVESAYNA